MLIHNIVFLQMDSHKCCYKRVVCFEKNHTYSRGYFFLKLHLKLHLSKNLMQFHDLFLNILKKKKKRFSSQIFDSKKKRLRGRRRPHLQVEVATSSDGNF